MPKDVKPLEVVIHPLPGPEGRLLLEPLVIASAEFRQRGDTDLLQPAQVIAQLTAPDLPPRRVAQIDGRAPLLFLQVIQPASEESGGLVAHFRRGDVRE